MLTLAPNVWPRNAVRGADGTVSIAGVPVTALAQEYGTPLFVIDEDDFRSRCRDMAEAFGGGEHVRYAAKAFLCTEVARWVDEEGLSLDVASGGELAVALNADFPPERIAFHGNNKSVPELVAAVKAGVGHVVLDSLTEIERLDTVAGDAGIVQDVGSRPIPTSSSRPPTRTRSSGCRWPVAPRWTQCAGCSPPITSGWSGCTATSGRRSLTSPDSNSPPTG
jgi:diaminopimelate decarboxylase